MRIALVHDYLAQDGGAERVLSVFHELWPKAPIFVLFYNKRGVPQFKEADVRQSFISKLPFGKTHYQWYLPFMPLATERHNLDDFDVVISSSSAFAKGVITGPDTLHICFCHTPTRYLWTETHEYISELRYNRFLKSFLPPLIHRLRIWDRQSVDRVDYFIAVSRAVQHRIAKFYRRESDILYPPVDVSHYSIAPTLGNYFLAGGRIAAYKRFDLIIQTFNRLGLPLKIFGTGPSWWENLKQKAKPNIEFLGRVSEEEKRRLFQETLAYIHPQIEDFGITAVEAMAAGRPVIAFAAGGAYETVVPGKTGVLFYEQTWEALLNAVLNFDPHAWDAATIRHWAMRFDTDRFKAQFTDYVEDRYEEFRRGLDQCRLNIL